MMLMMLEFFLHIIGGLMFFAALAAGAIGIVFGVSWFPILIYRAIKYLRLSSKKQLAMYQQIELQELKCEIYEPFFLLSVAIPCWLYLWFFLWFVEKTLFL